MFVVYSVESGCMSLVISSCGENQDSPVDHLHFDLKVSRSTYHEAMEGVIGVTNTDTVCTLVDRCMDVYANETLKMLKGELARGLESLR